MTSASRGRGRPAEGRPVQIRIPDQLLAQVDSVARTQGVTRAQMIRQLLAERLDAR